MTATFDNVCAAIACPCCGQVPGDPCSIGLQTHATRSPQLRDIHVGDPFEPADGLRAAGYLQIADAPQLGNLRILETWSCPNCGTPHLWAKLRITGDVLRDVQPAGLAPEDLEEADSVSDEALLYVPLDQVPTVQALPPGEMRARLKAIGWRLRCAKDVSS